MNLLSISLAALALAASARADLTPPEQQTYQSLPQESQRAYLDTRNFVHIAEQVVSGKIAPLSLPDEPKDFDSSLVTAKEKALIDKAFNLKINAMLASLP